jgi:hypothetical protein
MTQPTAYLARMAVFLAAVAGLGAFLRAPLLETFNNNPLLNGLILAIMAIGIVWNLVQVLRLRTEVTWLETYRTARARIATLRPPRLLAPMASMLAARESYTGEKSPRLTLSTQAMRGLLDGIGSRLDESRELSRYMTGVLIFLGLLGTFWGLLHTIRSVADVIAGMSVGTGDVTAMFDQLKSGLARPLSGMGTAFSASLFGLSGALILGFLDLTAGQAQNRFHDELEEWLASLTRLASGALGEGDASVPVYVQALLEQTAENMENLQRILTQGEASRQNSNAAVMRLVERMSDLSDTMRTQQQLMLRVAENQMALTPVLQRLSEPRADGNAEAARASLRAIEAALSRLIAELEQGRAQATAELRSDIRLLTRTIAALSEEAPR